MAPGEEAKTRSEPQVEIQERGDIFFFYRPKVEREEAQGPDDVQRLYLVLRPESAERPVEEKQDPESGKEGAKKVSSGERGSDSGQGSDEGGHGRQEVNVEKEPPVRFIVMGRKMLPDPSKKRQPFWGFVDLVTTEIDDVKNALKGEEYETSTRGRRRKPPARALGEGAYRILRHNPSKRMHTHLVYKLELPPEGKEDEPQETLNLGREGSYVMQIKNPDQDGSRRFRGLQNKRKARFPAHLQAQLGHRRFIPADPPDFLNHEGCEFLLIAASDDLEEELGLEIKTEWEADPSCSDLLQTFGRTTVKKPLIEGAWA